MSQYFACYWITWLCRYAAQSLISILATQTLVAAQAPSSNKRHHEVAQEPSCFYLRPPVNSPSSATRRAPVTSLLTQPQGSQFEIFVDGYLMAWSTNWYDDTKMVNTPQRSARSVASPKSGVITLLRAEGVKLRRRLLSNAATKRAIQLYEKGLTIQQVADQANSSYGTIRKMLHKGVQVRENCVKRPRRT